MFCAVVGQATNKGGGEMFKSPGIPAPSGAKAL